MERLSLGSTSKTQAELHGWLESVRSRFTQASYDLFHNNCNNFSDAVVKFLLGESSASVPASILELPQRVLNTPIGQLLTPMYQTMQTQMQAHMVPFNDGLSADPSPAPSADNGSGDSSASQNDDAAGVVIPIKVSNKESSVSAKVSSYESTVGDLMAAIERETGYAIADQRLILKGQMLKDASKSLSAYGVAPEVVVHLVPKPNAVPHGGAASSSSTQAGAGIAADPLEAAIMKMKTAPTKDLKVALKTLQKIVENVVNQPLEEKYRKIKRANPALSKRLDHVPGAFDCLLAIGFIESAPSDGSEKLLTLEASEAAWAKILQGNKRLKEELAAAETSAATPAPNANPFAAMMGAGMPPMGGFPGTEPPPLPPGMDANMMRQMMSNPMVQQHMQQVLSDPAALQQMLNSPVMQQMAASNPGLQQQLQMVAQNPGMMSAMMNMMNSNPSMFQGLAGAGLGGNPGGQTPASGGGQNNSQGDSQMSEEEMIQEAIRRSLQDQ